MERNRAASPSRGASTGPAVRLAGFLLIVAVLAAFPFVSDNRFTLSLVTEMMVFGLVAMSFDLLVGYTGLVPFGHCAYFGLGAYVVGLSCSQFSAHSFWLLLLLGAVVPAVVAVPFGWLMVRLGGIAFALLNMAFSMMFYTFFWKWRSVTGGDDGLPIVQRPDLYIGGWSLGNVDDFQVMYFVALSVALLCFILLRRVIRSPFGAALRAIRSNEERASFIGFNVHRTKLVSFVLACTLAGIAGSLYGLHRGHIVPGLLHWSQSGEVLVMALLGGIGTLWGPFLGAAVFIFAKDYISTMTEHWMVFLGLLLILIVRFMPQGLAGLRQYFHRGKLKRKENDDRGPEYGGLMSLLWRGPRTGPR